MKFQKAILPLTVFCVALAAYWWRHDHRHNAKGEVLPFDYARDAAAILNTFDADRYWLSANPDYPVAKMLETRSPKDDLAYAGLLDIRVVRDQDIFKGFVAFYKESATMGHILFLAIPKAYRGQGHGERLIRFALDEMRHQGLKRGRIVTRTNNYPAQKLYKKFGFTEVSQSGGFIYYEMAL